MEHRFLRNLGVVATVHVAVVLTLSLISGCRRFFQPTRPETIPIEFTVEVPGEPVIEPLPISPPVESTPAPPPTPAPVPAPVAEPKTPEVPVKKPPRPKIQTSQRRVTRHSAAEEPSRLTQEEIERLLAEGARPSDHTQIPTADARGFARVRAAFYQVWVQPSRAEVGDAVAEGVIVLGTGGRVISGRLSSPSGNAVLDNSVRRALNSVKQVTGLPRGFEERHREMSVAFRVE